jgi:hypothetical protein
MTAAAPLTHAAERRLYVDDYPAWLEYSAPRLAHRIAAASASDLPLMWSLLTRPAQLAVWPHLDATQQARVRELRDSATA